MRRHIGQRSHTRSLMMTEYQEKFLPPRCSTAHVQFSTNKQPYQQQLKALNTSKVDTGTMSNRDDQGRTIEMPTFSNPRSCYMAAKWNDHSSHLPPVTGCCYRRCPCPQFCAVCKKAAEEAQITVYKDSYPAWKLSKQQPHKHHDSLNVSNGLNANMNSNVRPPIESTTTYKTAYIPHPVQPREPLDNTFRTSQLKLAYQTCCGKCMPVPRHGTVHDFKARSLETKFPSPGKGGCNNPNQYLSITHSDFTTHKLPRTTPIIPPKGPEQEKSIPFQGTTTMEEDYRAWDLPRRQSASNKICTNVWKNDKKQMFNHCGRCHANYMPLDTAAHSGSMGFECVAAETTGYLPRTTEKDHPAHQMISYMASSSRN